MSLLTNKHGQKKGDRPLFSSVELFQVVLKNIKKQKKQKWERKKLQISHETFKLLFC